MHAMLLEQVAPIDTSPLPLIDLPVRGPGRWEVWVTPVVRPPETLASPRIVVKCVVGLGPMPHRRGVRSRWLP
jgi:hypothetical protein